MVSFVTFSLAVVPLPLPFQTYVFSPSSVDTLGVLTVIEQQLCLDRCAARACPANSLLFIYSTFMPLELLQVHFDSAGCVHFRT